MRAPFLPQISQIIVFTFIYKPTDRDDDQLACRADFRNGHHFIARNSVAFDQILPLSSNGVFLTFNNLTCEQTAFYIKDAQIIVAHFFFRMQGHDILTLTNLLADLFQDALKHSLLPKPESHC